MKDDTKNENILPAMLEEGESVIPQDNVNEFQAFFDEINKPTITEITAEEYGIKISKPKVIPETDENNIIGSSGTQKSGGKKKSNVVTSVNNTITSNAADKASTDNADISPVLRNKVAVYASKNTYVSGLGKIYKGYNILTPDMASEWISRNYVRLATPEEIIREFGR